MPVLSGLLVCAAAGCICLVAAHVIVKLGWAAVILPLALAVWFAWIWWDSRTFDDQQAADRSYRHERRRQR
jgi:hypothetical protein